MAQADGYKYKGEDTIYLVDLGDGLIRPFDQTDGSTSFDIEELEVSTKDRTGSDYGDVTETRSFEGELVLGDPFINAIKKAMRNKQFVKIYEVDLITNEAEYGMHMISNFDLSYSNGDFATYSLDATLFGNTHETTVTEEEIPEGATDLITEDDQGNGGVEG